MKLKVVLLASYELGHQPLSLAWPLATINEAGFDVLAQDLSVETLSIEAVEGAGVVGMAAPMHTAMRLGVQVAKQVRTINPNAHICFYGLYAQLNASYLLQRVNGALPLADSVIAGEYEAPLLNLVRTLENNGDVDSVRGVSTPTAYRQPNLERLSFPLPRRDTLPSLDHYAHYIENGTRKRAGYVEASRGCLHICRHCPITPIYEGRFFVVPAEVVKADIEQQIAAGAHHITFGDPDFLNGPGHSRRIVKWLHETHNRITFDFTAKVEHILEHRGLMHDLKSLGASFVVSAFEASNDRVLARLNKGHTVSDMDEALTVLADAGLSVQPTWTPFTPWTTLQDYLDLLAWIHSRDLVPNTPPVQLSIRLLVPPGSALLEHRDRDTWVGDLDAPNFVYAWQHRDPRMDSLQREIANLVAQKGGDAAFANETIFNTIETLAYSFAGLKCLSHSAPKQRTKPPPRLSEDWFC
ncbi:MAG: radical SAM protein [Chloroflexi bacterium]|nr:radical SAM protein [Chloroflexota bacterium]